VILLADHGEEFREHGTVGHIGELHFEVLHVPLVVIAPGLKAGKLDAPAGLVDVLPTVLDLLRVKGPRSQGLSLVPFLKGGASKPEDRPLFSVHGSGPDIRSVIKGNLHLIARSGEAMASGEPELELYDLDSDPLEKLNIQASRQGDVKRLLGLLDKHLAKIRRAKAGYARKPTADELEQLRSLGYVD